MSLTKVFWIFFSITWVLLIVLFASGIAMGNATTVGWAFEPVLVLFVLVMTFGGAACGCFPTPGLGDVTQGADKEVPAEPDKEVSAEPDKDESAKHSENVPQKKKRKYWLDNIKVFLTIMVVFGHSGMAWWGAGAFVSVQAASDSWYTPVVLTGLCLFKPLVVPLFYFISGYFTPSSFDRKGPAAFLKASFCRLGTAFLIFWLLLNPMNALMAYALVNQQQDWIYFPTSPHTYFILFLLVFQCMYATIGGGVTKMTVPSFCTCMKYGCAVTGVQILASGASIMSALGFAEMPMMGPSGDGFFTVFLFATGVVAKRNSWFSWDFPEPLVKSAKIYVYTVALFTIIACFLFASPGSPMALESDSLGIFLLAMQIPLGPFCLFLCLVVINHFQHYCDSQNAFTQWLGKCAFAVYLFHYYFVTIMTWLFVEMVDSDGFIVSENATSVSTDPRSDKEVFGGFFFTAFSSTLLSFLFAGLLKLIPGLPL